MREGGGLGEAELQEGRNGLLEDSREDILRADTLVGTRWVQVPVDTRQDDVVDEVTARKIEPICRWVKGSLDASPVACFG